MPAACSRAAVLERLPDQPKMDGSKHSNNSRDPIVLAASTSTPVPKEVVKCEHAACPCVIN